jgi:hypothetical protein
MADGMAATADGTVGISADMEAGADMVAAGMVAARKVPS